MKVDEILASIQNSCDQYIQNNIAQILKKLSRKKVPLTQPLQKYSVKDIGKNCWGVYVFYIKPKAAVDYFLQLKSLWLQDQTKDKKRLHSPAAILSRFSPMALTKWSVLYVGKSENLCARISQHIHQTTAFTTYGLKLSERPALLKDFEFAYSYFEVKSGPIASKDGMRCIVVTLERVLRKQLAPLIGKQ